MKENKILFEFIVFDCCYMLTLKNMLQFQGLTHYILGCQSASPNLGFLSPGLSGAFVDRSTTLKTLKVIADAFIDRNDENPHRELEHFTDAGILDLTCIPLLTKSLNGVTLHRHVRARTEQKDAENPWSYKDLLDLHSTVKLDKSVSAQKKNEILRQLDRIVVYYRQSKLLKEKSWSSRLHGLSIVLKHKEVKF